MELGSGNGTTEVLRFIFEDGELVTCELTATESQHEVQLMSAGIQINTNGYRYLGYILTLSFMPPFGPLSLTRALRGRTSGRELAR
jgi:hypothetical protein